MNATRLLLPALLLAAPAVQAGTIKVPQDQPTIQAAVDASLDGDVIEIKGGNYEESVNITGKTGLHLVGKGSVKLFPPAAAPGLAMSGCTDCILEKISVIDRLETGFELTGGTGGSLLQCRVDNAFGDGIRLDDCDGVTLDSCFVKLSGGNGIALATGTATPTDNCTVTNCKVLESLVDGINVNGSGNTI